MRKYSNMSSISLEHPNVRKVIKIAEEIVNENKILNIDILYNRAKRILKIPRRGLNRIIQFLLNNKILVNHSKYIRKTVLSNNIRQKIYYFIQVNTGAHFSLLKKHFSTDDKIKSSGELIWHLDMLIKFNYIKKLKFQKYSIFILSEIDEDMGILSFLLNNELNNKIIGFLISNGSIKKNELYKELCEKRENVYYHLNILVESQILQLDEKNNIMIKSNLENKILSIFNKEKKKPKLVYAGNYSLIENKA